MIKINLLPQTIKEKRQTQVPGFFLIVVLCLGVIVAAFYLFQSTRINSLRKSIVKLQNDEQNLKPKVQAIEDQLTILEQRNQAISQLAGQERLIWSQKFNELALLIPERIRFNRIYIFNDDGAKKRYLKIEGIAFCRSGEDRVSQIARLLEALKADAFYKKPSGAPNFGEIEFIQADSSEDKSTGWNSSNFTIQMEIL